MARKRKAPASGNDNEASSDSIPSPSKKGKVVLAKGSKASSDSESLVWSNVGTSNKSTGIPLMLAYTSPNAVGRAKIAAFDIDWTIIGTKSGKQFSQKADDWKWLYDEDTVVGKLKELDGDGYRIIFVTNQAGIEKGHTPISMIKGKVEGIIGAIGLPIYAFVSTGESHYRKPATGMFDHFQDKCNGKVKIDYENSIYVGDAAGRPKDWAPGKKKDFSCSDRKFAANIGLRFETPEEFFLGQKPVKFEWGGFDPGEFMSKLDAKKSAGAGKQYHKKEQEMVILVGLPGSGKSYFAERHFVNNGYVWVNRDTLSTASKCLKAADAALEDGKSVVVDNTNPSKAARAEYIACAKDHKVPVRCFHINTPEPIAHHLNYVRQVLSNGKQRRVPDVAYNVCKKGYEKPVASEGFSEVIEVDFEPIFQNERHRKVFQQWT